MRILSSTSTPAPTHSCAQLTKVHRQSKHLPQRCQLANAQLPHKWHEPQTIIHWDTQHKQHEHVQIQLCKVPLLRGERERAKDPRGGGDHANQYERQGVHVHHRLAKMYPCRGDGSETCDGGVRW